MFGILYDQEEDLAATILEATLATPAKDESKWENKLYEISATNFGRRVYEFYLDAIISKDFYNERHPEESRTKRVTKSIVKIPQKVIAMPVNGSVRIMKGSFKQVKKIRNITKLLD